MREFKFRVLSEEGMTYLQWKDVGIITSRFNVAILADAIINGQRIMQYTGLNDEDGKEIYEGDIIKFLGNWDEEGNVIPASDDLYRVAWSMGGFHAMPVEPSFSARFADKWKGVGHTNSLVVGNIYE